MSNISITRYSFFPGDSQTLRFAEYAPPQTDCDHPICNCTRHVAERPKGEPRYVSQTIVYEPELEWRNRCCCCRLNPRFDLTNGRLTFKWPLTEEVRAKLISPFRDSDKTQEASFSFSMTERMVNIGMSVPGYGGTDYTQIRLCMGRNIDTSKFVNGWMPSKIEEIATIPDDTIWLHGDSWGKEMMQILTGDEVSAWRNTFIKMELLSEMISRYRVAYYDQTHYKDTPSLPNETITWPVTRVLESIEQVPGISQTAHEIIEHCNSVIVGFLNSNLFNAIKVIDGYLYGEDYVKGIRAKSRTEDLIDRSSFGTQEVKDTIADVDPAIVKRILERADNLRKN